MKIDRWFQPAILILVFIFLVILWQYAENGRYTYHKEIGDLIDNKYVVDTRSGIIYGEINSIVGQSNFYETNLKIGQILLKPHKIINNMYKESATPPSKIN